MSEIFLPLQPRPLEDPAAAGVVQANLEYLMQLFQKGVNDGDTLVWDSTVGRFLAKSAGGILAVTTLTGVDIYPGREIILSDSLTSANYFWHLRYNANSISPYKWEFLGGTPAHEQEPGGADTTSTVYAEPNGYTGPQITLPAGVGGDFIIECGMSGHHDSQQEVISMSYSIAGGSVDDEDACRAHGFGVGSLGKTSVMSRRRKSSIPPGATIRAKYRSTTSGNQGRCESRFLSVWPYRVG